MAIIGISGKIGSGKDTVAKIIQYLHCPDECRKYIDVLGWHDPSNSYLLTQHSTWKIKKFAGKLKETVALFIGCTLEDLEDIDFKNKPLGEDWNRYQVKDFMKPKPIYFNTFKEARDFCSSKTNSQHCYTFDKVEMTPRLFMQLLGTDCFRDIIHPNAHVNGLFSDYNKKFNGGGLSNNDLTETLPNWLITDVRFPNEADAINSRAGYLLRLTRHRTFDHDELCNLIMDKLDNANPNMDHLHEFAKRLDLEYDENTELYVDVEDIHVGKEHESETALDDYTKFDVVLENNGTIDELVEKIKQLNII